MRRGLRPAPSVHPPRDEPAGERPERPAGPAGLDGEPTGEGQLRHASGREEAGGQTRVLAADGVAAGDRVVVE